MKEITVFEAIKIAADKIGAKAEEDGKIIKIEKNGRFYYIYENIWPLNYSSSYAIAKDKAETHLILSKNGLPSVEQISIRSGEDLPIDKALAFFKKNGGKVVLKNNFGSKGGGIILCESLDVFQKALAVNLARYPEINCSKFIEIVNEYRCVVLDGEVVLSYLKKRPFVIGDGKRNIISLLAASQFKIVKLKKELAERLNSIPAIGEKVVLSDQDNLSLGAKPEPTDDKSDLFAFLTKTALGAAKTLELMFCSVDIVLDSSGNLQIIEVNSGIMFDSFLNSSPKNRHKVIEIFAEAIGKLS